MSSDAKLANLTPLPGKLLYPDDKEKASAYDNLPTDEAKFKEGGKWWSMYDLMKEFHNGILPEHSDANYFEFEIDFTSPHLKVAAVTDPNMLQEVNSTMTNGLQSLSSNIQNLISKLQMEANTALVSQTTSALARPQRGGSKGKGRNKRGGQLPEAPAAAPAPALAPAAALAAPAATADQLTKLVSAESLEAECLKDIFRVKLNTWDRIFITNAKPNTLKAAASLNLPKESAIRDQVIAAAQAQGGARTRKMKRRRGGSKKGKTHRRRR